MSKPNWTKGLETRQSADDAALANQPDAVGDGLTRLGAAQQGYVVNMVNAGSPTAKVLFADLKLRVYGPDPALVSFWAPSQQAEPDPAQAAWTDRDSLSLTLVPADDETVLCNVAIYDSSMIKLDEIEFFVLKQDNLGIGAPPP